MLKEKHESINHQPRNTRKILNHEIHERTQTTDSTMDTDGDGTTKFTKGHEKSKTTDSTDGHG